MTLTAHKLLGMSSHKIRQPALPSELLVLCHLEAGEGVIPLKSEEEAATAAKRFVGSPVAKSTGKLDALLGGESGEAEVADLEVLEDEVLQDRDVVVVSDHVLAEAQEEHFLQRTLIALVHDTSSVSSTDFVVLAGMIDMQLRKDRSDLLLRRQEGTRGMEAVCCSRESKHSPESKLVPSPSKRGVFITAQFEEDSNRVRSLQRESDTRLSKEHAVGMIFTIVPCDTVCLFLTHAQLL
mmetsp:Transcript_28788/g.92898  ORF Transcript_28788/g.92898 Transcript_28788/m.92898 type:complete len:238 (+) Transcript_28788:150-863(+)